MLGRVEEIRLIAECVMLDNRDAFGRLVDEYQPALRTFLLNLTLGDVMLSEDLAQEAFVKAYLNLRNFRGVSRFRTWLYRIACNEYYTYMAAHRDTADLDSARHYVAAGASGATDASIDVQRCMAELSVAERTVVSLFYLEDLTIKQISAITEISEGTIKSHLSRAKEKMRRFIQNDEYDGAQ